MDDSNVKAALIAAAVDFLTEVTEISTESGTYSDLPTIPLEHVAWENVNFDQPTSDTWAAVFYVPNIPEGRTVGAGGFDDINGFMQIDLNIPNGSGDGGLNAWENKARKYFVAGRSFHYSGQKVLAIQSGLSQGRNVDNNFKKSLTVFFKAQLKREILTN